MKKIRPILVITLLLSGILQAQEYQEILRDIFNDAEYWLADESYIDALGEYQKLYTRGYDNNSNINYRIGICYLNIAGEKSKAIPYLEKATENLTPRYKEGIFKEAEAPYDSWLYLGNAYRIDNQLEKSVEAYNKYKALIDDDEESIGYADKQIMAINKAQIAMESPAFHIREHLGEIINTGTADYNPVVTYDEQTIAYMTSLKFYEAVNISRKENGVWTAPRQITAELEPEGKLYVNSISRDGETLYLNIEDNFNSDILVSAFDGERWSKARPLNKFINTKFWESHASISADGEYLYFTSNRKEGQGGMDIWVSRNGSEGWGEPRNLGPGINTSLNEDHPFLSEDGKVLYFASQGHDNMGGYDIFHSERLADGSWAEPVNLGYPINTTDDDMFFLPLGNGKYGYQALFAEGNIGSRDIYRFQLFETEAEYLAALAAQTEQPVEEVAEVAEPVVTETPEVETTEPAEPEQPEKPDEPEISPPVEEVAEIMYVIRPVFFGFDRYDLTAESKNTLNDVVDILNALPVLEIEAVGHTDHKGSDNYNLMLSKKRSASVVEYITRRGIDGRRIKSVGKGESFPVARNTMPDGSDSPEGRKLNRRVEILVVKPELPNVKVEDVKVPDKLKK